MTAPGARLLALVAIVFFLGAVSADASHGDSAHVSQGTINGNGPNFALFAGASADGDPVFFTTSEVLADTDT